MLTPGRYSMEWSKFYLKPHHTKYLMIPCCLQIWKTEKIGNKQVLIGASAYYVGLKYSGKGQTRYEMSLWAGKIFDWLKKVWGWSRSPQVVCWAGYSVVVGVQRRFIIPWSRKISHIAYIERILNVPVPIVTLITGSFIRKIVKNKMQRTSV